MLWSGFGQIVILFLDTLTMTRHFHVFVANRVQQIHDHNEPFQWNYIYSTNNPANIPQNELMNKRIWFNGPDFL